jgi:hypothetical protein
MHTLSLKRNRGRFSALALTTLLTAAANGCSTDGADPSGIGQSGDELKGGTPAGGKGKTKDHGKSANQAGAGGAEAHGQGNEHSQAGHGSSADHGGQAGHGQAKAHIQAGHGADDQDTGTDETK